MKATRSPSRSEARATLDSDGVLTIHTSSVEMGQGARTILLQIGAEVMGADPASVIISMPDTDTTPYDMSTSSSRTTHSMGIAVERAVSEVRRQLVEAAANLNEISSSDLAVDSGHIIIPDTNVAVSFREVMQATGLPRLDGGATYENPGYLNPDTGLGLASSHWHQAAAYAEVEVDDETGKVRVLSCHASVFAGRVVNPVLAELQVQGSMVLGIGQALFEDIVFDLGYIANANLSEYPLPGYGDLAEEMSVSLLEDLRLGEFHGVGETGVPPVVAAIGNAVTQAIGHPVKKLPITPESVLAIIDVLGKERTR
jgi:CO/xanthine dehydrogenase Mo-binding subunit